MKDAKQWAQEYASIQNELDELQRLLKQHRTDAQAKDIALQDKISGKEGNIKVKLTDAVSSEQPVRVFRVGDHHDLLRVKRLLCAGQISVDITLETDGVDYG